MASFFESTTLTNNAPRTKSFAAYSSYSTPTSKSTDTIAGSSVDLENNVTEDDAKDEPNEGDEEDDSNAAIGTFDCFANLQAKPKDDDAIFQNMIQKFVSERAIMESSSLTANSMISTIGTKAMSFPNTREDIMKDAFYNTPISTKTVVVWTNCAIDLLKLFQNVPITPFQVPIKKRGRRKKGESAPRWPSVAAGSIIGVRFQHDFRGTAIKSYPG